MTGSDQVASLRDHLLELLQGRYAHAPFDKVLEDWPAALRGVKPGGIPYTPWQVLEHLRVAQWDIVEFSVNPKHVSPEYPEGYWPALDEPPGEESWDKSIRVFSADLGRMKALVEDRSLDLFEPFAHGSGQTLLREAMLLADHNAYHVGQLVTLRRLLGAWR
jgi:hypothetical protein